MGIISFKSLNDGEHCHRFYNRGEKKIIICKNKKCINHCCGFHDCKLNKYFRYWKYDYFGKKIEAYYCENNCLCHLTECVVLNKRRFHDKSRKKNSNDAFADPFILNCHRCYSSDNNHHNFDFDFDD